jgi:hypothetical protein
VKETDGTEQDFQTLRQAGIAAAQAASGNIWTDYNLHDPGVTLLEQTCFALSEVSFRAQHAVPDLLTDRDGHLVYDALRLFLPERVLPGDPVTLLDLAAALAEDPQVARALLAPGARSGLIDVIVIPAQSLDKLSAEDRRDTTERAVRRSFAAMRPLGCDLGRVQIAQRRRARLDGSVQITATAQPDKVAADIYFRVGAILRGVPVGAEIAVAATRAMVYDRPQTFLHAPSDQDGKIPKLENHLSALRDIPGVRDLSDLTLLMGARGEDAALGLAADEATAEKSVHFLDLPLPDAQEDIGLTLEVSGVPLPMDAGRIAEEYIRISADAIARARHHLDAEDWIAPPAGRRRSFDHADVDAMLPTVYATRAKRSRSQKSMADYREMVNAHLGQMNEDLGDLPDLFDGTDRHVPRDPAIQRRRIDVLDYQLALQGEEMPATNHAGLHTYRSAAERYAFDVAWRQRFLARLPELNRARGTGPSQAAQGGFMEKFLLLADLEAGRFPSRPPTWDTLALNLAPDASLPEPDYPAEKVLCPNDPYRVLAPPDPNAARLAGSDLQRALPWLVDRPVSPSMIARLANPRNFVVSAVQAKDDANALPKEFVTLFDAGLESGLFRCGTFDTQNEASRFADKIRATWADLHRYAEGAVLIEDILLRPAPTHYTPHLAYMVMPGWTARMSQAPFRSYVKGLVAQVAPAHMLIQLLWLDFAESATFADLLRAQRAQDDDAGPTLRQWLAERVA